MRVYTLMVATSGENEESTPACGLQVFKYLKECKMAASSIFLEEEQDIDEPEFADSLIAEIHAWPGNPGTKLGEVWEHEDGMGTVYIMAAYDI